MKKLCILRVILLLFFVFTLATGCSNPDNDESNPIRTGETAPPVDPMVPDEPTYKVVIDPGHGGSDSGAEGASGRFEKDFNLQISLKVKELLEVESKIEMNLTRTDDTFISSIGHERAELANEFKADVLITFHRNSYTDPSVSGTESYYYDEKFLSFANVIHKNVVRATGFKDRGLKQEDYFVLKKTNMPAVLIEVGYMTNPQEEQKMWKDEFQERVAISIVEGIKEYFEITP